MIEKHFGIIVVNTSGYSGVQSITLTGSLCSLKTITGCFPKFKKLIDDNAVVIVAVALGIAVLEVGLLAKYYPHFLICMGYSRI